MTVIINAMREEYSKEKVETMTVGELIDFLSQFNEDDKIILSHDNGYTFGGIRERHFEEDDCFEEEEEF